jgi:hypothetical protein
LHAEFAARGRLATPPINEMPQWPLLVSHTRAEPSVGLRQQPLGKTRMKRLCDRTGSGRYDCAAVPGDHLRSSCDRMTKRAAPFS